MELLIRHLNQQNIRIFLTTCENNTKDSDVDVDHQNVCPNKEIRIVVYNNELDYVEED